MKRKMAFVDLTNFKDWPMGGMLEYELAILPYLAEYYDLDIWGYSLNGVIPMPLVLNGKEYPVHVCGNCSTNRRIIPNFWRGLSIFKHKSYFLNRYDIVYAHTGSCMCAIGNMIDRKKTKLVYHQHGLSYLTDFQMRSLIQRPSFYFAQKYAHLVFVVSDETSTNNYAATHANVTKAHYQSIGSPIDISQFDMEYIKRKVENRKDVELKKFLYTGRLSKNKNVKLLVTAFERYVKNGHSDAVLNIAGSGEELDLLKRMKLELGINNNVNVLGQVPHDEIYDLLKEADVFVTASEGEGCSISVLEAYASGLPVICGRMPGLEGQVSNNKTGIFVKDMTAECFHEAMEKMNIRRYRLSLNCLKEARNYDKSIIAHKIIECIEDLFKE